ncbi:MAG: cation-translocating P-type ATPase, partial [Chloroflexi bacterium]|nr:cation-translocating P-type ATPase [Chloroflexota bacterium]
MAQLQTVEVPIQGMDCAECTQHVQHAIAKLPGVASVNVYLSSEKAIIQLDPALVEMTAVRKAVEGAGYAVPEAATPSVNPPLNNFTQRIVTFLGVVFGAVLFIIVIGEWFGLFARLTERVPFVVGLALVVASGWSIFLNVARAALKRQITSHTLMTLGLIAALVVGQ